MSDDRLRDALSLVLWRTVVLDEQIQGEQAAVELKRQLGRVQVCGRRADVMQ